MKKKLEIWNFQFPGFINAFHSFHFFICTFQMQACLSISLLPFNVIRVLNYNWRPHFISSSETEISWMLKNALQPQKKYLNQLFVFFSEFAHWLLTAIKQKIFWNSVHKCRRDKNPMMDVRVPETKFWTSFQVYWLLSSDL